MTAPFTSDLSIDELVLLEEMGFDPIRFVMGTCHWHVGIQYAGWTQTVELDQLTRAMAMARHGAMDRVERQLLLCEADGLVGTRIVVRHHGEHVEFCAFGTAVRHRTDRARWHRPGPKPFTSALKAQDLYLLDQAGYAPRALVMGNCVQHVARQGLGTFLKTVGQNTEMEAFTQALYDARETAMQRLQREAEQAGADGVVGMTIHEGRYGWSSHVIEFFAVGTAVARVADPGTPGWAAEPNVQVRFDVAR